LRRVVDFVLVEGDGRLTKAIADRALTRLGVDHLGLDGADRRYLSLLAENYGGGPVGVETIAAALSEARDAIEEVIEPYLLQQGLIQRTPRGRMLAAKAWRHLGLEAPKGPGQADLFDTRERIGWAIWYWCSSRQAGRFARRNMPGWTRRRGRCG
jgi:holliday junction DNA helicase RuvB